MKKIFLLLLIIGIAISFPLAVFADDDDDDDYLVDASCPYYVIIEADVVYYPGDHLIPVCVVRYIRTPNRTLFAYQGIVDQEASSTLLY